MPATEGLQLTVWPVCTDIGLQPRELITGACAAGGCCPDVGVGLGPPVGGAPVGPGVAWPVAGVAEPEPEGAGEPVPDGDWLADADAFSLNTR